MPNLFVCHTQANLILAAGLAKGRFSGDTNDLILFRDFLLKEETEGILKNIFNKVVIRDGIYPASNNKWSKRIISISKDIRFLTRFIKTPYTRVFIICDANLQEMHILKKVYKANKNTEMIWLEDGSYPYYINTDVVSGFNSNKYTRLLRKLIFKNLLNLGRFYNFEGSYMAGNSNLTKVYLTLKGKERGIFKNKDVVAISPQEYLTGISLLFPVDNNTTDFEKNSILLALDKLDTYKNIDSLKNVLHLIEDIAVQNDKKVYYKLHPKEEIKLAEFDNFTELDKNKGIEYYYAAAKGNSLTVIGCKSTALMSACILGCNTISIAHLMGEAAHDLIQFYVAIGVSLPQNNAALDKQLL